MFKTSVCSYPIRGHYGDARYREDNAVLFAAAYANPSLLTPRI